MWGANSGITIRVNSTNADTMNVTILFADHLKGYPLNIGAHSKITVADISGDGVDELIASDGDSSYIVGSDGKKLVSFSFPNHPAAYYNTISGKYDFAVSSTDSSGIFTGYKIYSFSGNTFSSLSSYVASEPSTSFISSGNLSFVYVGGVKKLITDEIKTNTSTGVSSNEIILLNPEDTNPEKTVIPLTTISKIRSIASSGTMASAVCENDSLYTFKIDGSEVTAHYLGTGKTTDPILADIDRDGGYEIFAANGNKMFMFREDGSFKEIETENEILNGLVTADIDRDGYPELIFSTTKEVYALRNDLIVQNGFPMVLPSGDSKETITAGPIICDLNGDKYPEFIFPTSAMRLIAYDNKGRTINGFPVTTKEKVSTQPFLFTYAKNDSIALGYVTENGKIMARSLERTVSEASRLWAMYKGSPELNPVLLNEDITSKTSENASFKAYCYPNPIRNNKGTFRITPTGETYCSIKIYTADGLKVYEKNISENEMLPYVPNEFEFDATDLASGLYIARIETRQKTAFYKIGVIK